MAQPLHEGRNKSIVRYAAAPLVSENPYKCSRHPHFMKPITQARFRELLKQGLEENASIIIKNTLVIDEFQGVEQRFMNSYHGNIRIVSDGPNHYNVFSEDDKWNTTFFREDVVTDMTETCIAKRKLSKDITRYLSIKIIERNQIIY